MNQNAETPAADHLLDGGNMDCGSGLILLIRQNMLQVPPGGILEIRSTEPSVETELPPWCRMVGHTHLSTVQQQGQWRHFIRRGESTEKEEKGLQADKAKATEYKWSVRARRTSETTLYSRNFSWKSDHCVNFDRKGKTPTSLEQFYGSLLADLVNAFANHCSQAGIELDELEATSNATLNNPIAAAGVEPGDPSVHSIQLTLFCSSPAPEDIIRSAWDASTRSAPVLQTVTKACPINLKLVLL